MTTTGHRMGFAGSARGQTVPLFAIVLTVLVCFASLAIDSTNDQGSQLRSQLAADTSALGAASAWAGESAFGTGALSLASGDPVFVQAQELAGVNGVDTTPGGATGSCNSSSAGQAHIVFYDKPVVTCAVPAGWTRRVEVTAPPVVSPMPATCPAASLWHCVQVQTTMVVANRLFIALGLARTTVSASTIALATPGAVAGVNHTVAAGTFHSLAIAIGGGSVWGWGYNDAGAVGDGTSGLLNYQTRAKQVTALPAGHTWISVAGGGGNTTAGYSGGHSMALDSTGHVWTWGADDNGEMGSGILNTKANTTALEVLAGAQVSSDGFLGTTTKIVAMAAGALHDVAVDSSGKLFGWGDDSHGQLGDGGSGNKLVPVQAKTTTGMTNVTDVSAAEIHTLALDSVSGKVWGLGDNSEDELTSLGGSGNTAPYNITGFTGKAIHVAAGLHSSWVVSSDGTAWGWGDYGNGKLARSDGAKPTSITLQALPAQMYKSAGSPITNATGGIVGGDDNACVIDAAGAVWCAGKYVGDGQGLVQGYLVKSLTLTSGVVDIASGRAHILAVDASTNVWGFATNKATGMPSTLAGQIGNNSASDVTAPVRTLRASDNQPLTGIAAPGGGAGGPPTVSLVG